MDSLPKLPDYLAVSEKLTDLRFELETALIEARSNPERAALASAAEVEPVYPHHPAFDEAHLSEHQRAAHFANIQATMDAWFDARLPPALALPAKADLTALLADPRTPLAVCGNLRAQELLTEIVTARVTAMTDAQARAALAAIPSPLPGGELRAVIVQHRTHMVVSALTQSINAAYAARRAAEAPRDRFVNARRVETAATQVLACARRAEDAMEARELDTIERIDNFAAQAEDAAFSTVVRELPVIIAARARRVASGYEDRLLSRIDALVAGIAACQVLTHPRLQ